VELWGICSQLSGHMVSGPWRFLSSTALVTGVLNRQHCVLRASTPYSIHGTRKENTCSSRLPDNRTRLWSSGRRIFLFVCCLLSLVSHPFYGVRSTRTYKYVRSGPSVPVRNTCINGSSIMIGPELFDYCRGDCANTNLPESRERHVAL
jgi:hypothetical protein